MRLGDIVKDRVTGFKGMIVATTEWLNGCVRHNIQSQTLKDGKPIDQQMFDAEQLVLIKAGKHRVLMPTGGDRPAPMRHHTPKR